MKNYTLYIQSFALPNVNPASVNEAKSFLKKLKLQNSPYKE